MALRDSVLNVVIKARDKTGRVLKKFRGDLNDVEQGSKRTSSRIGTLAKRMAALAGAAVGINTLKNAIVSMLSAGDRFEKLALQMEQVMGSVEKGEQATEWVKEFTRNTPLQLEQATDAFLTLKNFGIDPMDGSLQAIVDQSAKMGKGFEGVRGISLALGQAWAKQKLQGEEILQLIERGVPVWEMLEKVTGKNTAQLQEMSEAGEIGRDVIRQLMQEMGRQSAGAAADNMSLLSGYISNLKDSWTNFMVAVADSGALDYVKDQLDALAQRIEQMRQSGELEALAKKISDGFVGAAEGIKTAIGFVVRFKDTIGALVAIKLVGWLGSGAKSAVDFAKGMKRVDKNTKAATTSTNLLTGAMGRLQQAMSIAFSAIAGWEIGTYLRDKFTVVEKAGIEMARTMTKSFEQIRFRWEMAKAAFTDDTLREAMERHGRRMHEINTIYDDMARSAGSAGEAAKQGAQEAGTAADQLKKKLDALKIDDDQLARPLRELKDPMDQVGEAAKAMGVDVEGAVSGIDEETRKAISGLRDVATSLKEAGEEGENASAILEDTLAKTLEDISSTEELEAVKEALQDMAEEGVLSSGQLADALKQVNRSQKDVRREADNTSTSLDDLGRTAERAGDKGSAAADSQADSMRDASAVAGSFYDRYQNIINAVEELGPKARAALGEMRGFAPVAQEGTGRIAEFEQAIQDTARAVDNLRTVRLTFADTTGMERTLARANVAAATVREEYYRQADAVHDLQTAYEDGKMSISEYINRAEGAIQSSDLLDDQTLNGLRSQIQAARNEMEALRSSTQGTVDSMRSELASLRGERERVAELEYEQRVRELEQALEEAEEAGDREAINNARESLSLARQIHRERMNQIEEEERAEREREQEEEARRLKPNAGEERPGERQEARPGPEPSGQTETPDTVVEIRNGNDSATVRTRKPDDLLRVIGDSETRTSVPL